jgi:hypothetical protein
MKPIQACNYIRAALKNIPHDKRFVVRPPIIAPNDADAIYVCLDFTGNGLPYSTSAAMFRLSEMLTLQGRDLDEYIEQEFRDADQELQDFISEGDADD